MTKARTVCKDSSGTRVFRYFIVQASGGPFIAYELADKNDAPSAPESPVGDARFQAAAVKAAFSQ